MDLVEKAKTGDSHAFDQLFGPQRPGVRDFLYRRLGDWDQAEDTCQEVLLHAFTHIGEIQKEAEIKPWLYALAHRFSEERVKEQATWSPHILQMVEDYLVEHPAVEKELQEIYLTEEEEFNISSHVEFCFTVTTKSLLHQEQEVFLLKEFGDLSWGEIADILGKDTKKVQEEFVDANEDLKEILSSKCSLVNPKGGCRQCKEFGEWLAGPEETMKQLQELPLQPQDDPGETFNTRLELIQDLPLIHAPMKNFHKALLALLRRQIGEIS